MFERLFGTSSADLRLTVSEALASQRKVIADQQARIEALIGERDTALNAVNDMSKALSERENDLSDLKAMLRDVQAGPQGKPAAAPTPFPARKPSFAQSSIASGHMRPAARPEKTA